MDLVKRLSASELFGQLSADELALVAGLARAHTIPAGTTLSRQADIGTTFFVIDSGEAIIQRVDDRGFARPVATLREGDTFGTTSLMLSEPRDATVVSSTEMNLWTIERRAFQDLLASRPSVARALSVPDEIAARLHMPDFAWLGPSERVVRYCHRHWMPLLLRVSAATLVLAAVLGVVLLYTLPLLRGTGLTG
jgi:signal-transduction protein with cAMP-binding, CBS, and nucleotidyltransferase domain